MLDVLSYSSFNAVEGILNSLEDDNDDIVQASLETLNDCVKHNWAEISEKLDKIEELSEQDAKPYNQLASLLASKVHYHIQSYQDALYHALQAQELFRVDEGTEYSQKLTEQCIDSYRESQQYHYNQKHLNQKNDLEDDDDEEEDIDVNDNGDVNVNTENYGLRRRGSTIIPKDMDPRLISIVERMLDYCFTTGEYKNAIGIACECRRLDYVEKAVRQSDNVEATLSHTFEICESNKVNSRAFKDELLTLVVNLYNALPNRNYPIICRCYFYLDNTKAISQILWNLIKKGSGLDDDNNDNNGTENENPNDNDNDNDVDMDGNNSNLNSHERELICYQICFDLFEFQNESFTRAIFDNIPKPPMSQLYPKKAAAEAQQKAEDAAVQGIDAAAPVNDANNTAEQPTVPQEKLWSEELLSRWKNVRSILLGEKITPLYLDFLYRNNNSDFLILKQYKDAIPERNSTLNNALVVCNGIMHCGTTIDQFLRDNLEWMGRAAHWAKFTATASLGMIHHHHLDQSMNILQRYLPGSGGGPYQEGGALYALGLIHNGDSSDLTTIEIRNYLIKQLKNASNEILQHGACLGLGLGALGYAQQNLSEEAVIMSDTTRTDAGTILSEIRNILFQDRAVPGESAGLSLGLILCGTGNQEWYDEMIAFCHETQHEKIIRGLSLGIAIMHYACEDKANNVIDQMIGSNEKDETIRYGGCYTVGMAYAGTANNDAISKLLHLAVSDVSNDVRRAAVTNIGFVLCNNPKQVPRVVQLLANSYNSHVRYGAAAALGIACAGTGNSDAVKILKVLLKDNVDFVRQAALISLGMLLMEQNKYETPYVNELREEVYKKIITNKRSADMSRLGAILGAGILDASGRNVTIQLYNDENKCKRQSAIVGMAVFWQYWYWYPLVPFIALCFKPTMVMGLNYQLNMVKLEVKSNVISNMFGYPEKLKEETKEKKKTLVKAELSITQKHKAREAKRAKAKEEAAAAEEAGSGDKDIEMTDANANANAKEASDGGKKENDKMDVDEPDKDGNKDKTEGDVDVETKPTNDNNESKEKSKEERSKTFEMLSNPSRVTPNQRKYIEWIDERYTPINGRKTNFSGIVIVTDTKPSEEIALVEQKTLSGAGVYGNEPDPPKPFKYLGD